MLFNSFAFILFFMPLTLAVALRLSGQRLLAWVTLASFTFYAFAGHWWFLIPMLITTVLDFFVAPFMARAQGVRKKLLLLVSLSGNLGLLFYFKYSALLVASAYQVVHTLFGISGGWGTALVTVLPAGISFYTFQTMSYIIDVYRGEAHPETNFWRFAGFVSFFPHLIAGPLTRHNQLIPGLKNIEQNGVKPRWQEGVFLFVVGLAKKVLIADRIANLIDPVISDLSHAGFIASWLAIMGYALQIYFDFSGYSDMAIGLARLFGIELPKNFNSPYQALNPTDFWKRWHMTLSSWLRDYLYFTLGGNRDGKFKRYRNLMITMVLGGLWHGANWTFAAWGFFHGACLVLYHMVGPSWDRMPKALQRALTFVLVCLGWVFFRSPDFTTALVWFEGLFGWHGLGLSLGGLAGVSQDLWLLAALVSFGLAIATLVRTNASYYDGFPRLVAWQQAALGVVTVVAVLFMNYSSRFLYFQF